MKNLLLISSIIYSSLIFAQKTEKGIEFSPFIGENFNLDSGIDYSFSALGVHFKYIKQSSGSQPWQQYFNLPRMGQELIVANYSDNGYSISANTFIEFDFLRSIKHELFLSPGIGLVYVSETSSTLEDYQLTSLHVNFSGKLGFGYRYAFSPDWKVSVGYFINHFSNGNISTPNQGINMQAFKVGVQHTLGKDYTPNYEPFEKQEPKRIYSQASFGTGVKDVSGQHVFFNAYFNLGVNLHPYHRFVGGLNLFVNQAFSADKPPSQFGYSFGYQVLVGKLGVSILPGWYTEEYYDEWRFYQFVLQYRFNPHFFIQSNLRITEDFYSEDLGLGLGIEI